MDKTEGPAMEAVPSKSGEHASLTVRYVDRPECLETFADSISGVSFDGQSLRTEFTVTRPDATAADAPRTGRRYPVCRMVLPPAAAVDLINRMQQVGSALAQARLLKANPQSRK